MAERFLRYLSKRIICNQNSQRHLQPEVLREQGKVGPLYLTRVNDIRFTVTRDKIQRIVAGDVIPDSERISFTDKDTDPLYTLPYVESAQSGRIGFVDFRIYPGVFGEKQMYIAHLGVEPAFRRKGVGTQLIRAVEYVAETEDVSSIRTIVAFRDKETVLKLMEKEGYKMSNRNDAMNFILYKV